VSIRVLGGFGEKAAWSWARRRTICFVFLGTSVFVSDQALADDITLQPKGTEFVEVDNNPLLLSKGARTAIGSVSSPEATINDDTATTHLDLDSRVDVNEYNLQGFSSVDDHEAFHSLYKGEVIQAGLNGGYDYDTTRTSELTTSGINIAGIRHSALNFAPQAALNLSAADTLALSGSYNRTQYGDTARYTNYDYETLTPAYQHNFDPLNLGTVALQATRFTTTIGPSVTIETVGPQFMWTRKFSERLTGTAGLGYQATINSLPAGLPNAGAVTWDYNFNFEVKYTGLQDTFDFTATRQPAPNGSGTETLTSAVNLDWLHAITTRISVEMAGTYQSSAYTTRAVGTQSDYLSLSPTLHYHLTEELDLSAQYRYRRSESTSAGTSASSNAALIHLTYTPTQFLLGL
jgi:hypothetical protein